MPGAKSLIPSIGKVRMGQLTSVDGLSGAIHQDRRCEHAMRGNETLMLFVNAREQPTQRIFAKPSIAVPIGEHNPSACFLGLNS